MLIGRGISYYITSLMKKSFAVMVIFYAVEFSL